VSRIFGSDPEAGPKCRCQPVRCASGQDVQQAAIWQPLQDRTLQYDRRRAPVGALAPGQHRLAALQTQVGVRRVARIDSRGGLGELLLAERDQRLRVGGNVGLLTEVRDLGLALLPGHHLGVQVGVGVLAGHGEVPGSQFGAQVGEHAHLQVPPGQHPGPAFVPQRPFPHLRGEGVDVDRDPDLLVTRG
jgi:hypothetical protein